MYDSYKPISCALYDSLEAYCVKKTILTITISEKNTQKTFENIFIKDLQTKNKEEFVILSNDCKIRLDKILNINMNKNS